MQGYNLQNRTQDGILSLKKPENGKLSENNRLIMRDFSDFYIKNYFISKIICNFAARNQYGIY